MVMVSCFFFSEIQSTSSYPSLVPVDLPLDARNTVLLGVSSVAGTICSFLSLPTCFHEANTQRMQGKTWRHKIYWVEAARGRPWSSCQRGAGEWVAGGLAPGTPNEESLPACLSIQPHQLIWCLADWQTRGGLNGHLGPHKHTEGGNIALNRCVCVLAWE